MSDIDSRPVYIFRLGGDDVTNEELHKLGETMQRTMRNADMDAEFILTDANVEPVDREQLIADLLDGLDHEVTDE